jgi:hypothetical protein
MAYLIVWDLLPPFRNVESIFRGIVDLGKVFLFFAGGEGTDLPGFRQKATHSQSTLLNRQGLKSDSAKYAKKSWFNEFACGRLKIYNLKSSI